MTLRRESVSPGLFNLLRKLMREEALDAFALGGGTSLALRFGHRESVDIDLFSNSSFDSRVLAEQLKCNHAMVEAE